MHELLIVDDEIHIAKGIQASVAWEELGISHVHIANSVRRAQDILRQRSVEIIICDIEMPVADGFELLDWVKRHYDPAAEVVFLTCHAEFAYAQKAIQMGGLDYILKPIRSDVLKTVVFKAIDKISSVKKYERLLVERFWQDLLNDRISSQAEAIRQRIDTLRLPVEADGRFVPIAVCVRRWLKDLSAREEQIMAYALGKIAEETFFAGGQRGDVITVGRGAVLVVLAAGERTDPSGIRDVCQTFLEACSQYLYCRLSCCVGKAVCLHEIKPMYAELLELDRQNVADRNRVLVYGENAAKNRADFAIGNASLVLWSELLKRGDQEKLQRETFSWIDSWQEEPGLDYKHLQIFYHGFLRVVHRSLSPADFAALSELMSPERGLIATRSVADLREWVTELTDTAIAHMRAASRRLTFSDQVKAYIADNLDRDFSRQELADHLHKSPDYVVKRFKKETGMAVSDYILRERMNRAKHLLGKTDMPIAEISLQVGFSNFSYFSKVFKNAMKLSPLEYRKTVKNA